MIVVDNFCPGRRDSCCRATQLLVLLLYAWLSAAFSSHQFLCLYLYFHTQEGLRNLKPNHTTQNEWCDLLTILDLWWSMYLWLLDATSKNCQCPTHRDLQISFEDIQHFILLAKSFVCVGSQPQIQRCGVRIEDWGIGIMFFKCSSWFGNYMDGTMFKVLLDLFPSKNADVRNRNAETKKCSIFYLKRGRWVKLFSLSRWLKNQFAMSIVNLRRERVANVLDTACQQVLPEPGDQTWKVWKGRPSSPTTRSTVRWAPWT